MKIYTASYTKEVLPTVKLFTCEKKLRRFLLKITNSLLSIQKKIDCITILKGTEIEFKLNIKNDII